MHAVRAAIAAQGAGVAQTPLGPIEYLVSGSGYPVLVVHGIWGGFDQGMLNAADLVDEHRALFISRLGYLGSTLPETIEPSLQADLYARLLDELGIDEVAVIAHSAGSTSALQFALRHPDRISALVLVSPNAPGPVDVRPLPRWLAEIAFRSDFLFWAFTEFAAPALRGMMGVPPGFDLSPADEKLVDSLSKTVLPARRRADGAIHDMYVSNPAVNAIDVEKIDVPTLIVSAKDDPLALHKNALALAEHMPSAQILSVPSGGHMLLGQNALVEPAIRAFLQRWTATVQVP